MISLNVKNGELRTRTFPKTDESQSEPSPSLEGDGALEDAVIEAALQGGKNDKFIRSIHTPRVREFIKEAQTHASTIEGDDTRNKSWVKKTSRSDTATELFSGTVGEKLGWADTNVGFNGSNLGEWRIVASFDEPNFQQKLLISTGADHEVTLFTKTSSAEGVNYIQEVTSKFLPEIGQVSGLDVEESLTAWEIR